MKNFVAQLWEKYESFMKELLTGDLDKQEMAKRKIDLVHGILAELKIFVYGYSFTSKGEEIEWYKQTMPKFLSEYLFLLEVWKLESARKNQGRHRFLRYLAQKEKNVRRFIQKEQFLDHYLVSGETYLDLSYFSSTPLATWHEESPVMETRICTVTTFRSAKLLAYKRLEKILENEMSPLDQKSDVTHTLQNNPGNLLHWTETGMSLTEMAYALKYSGAVNKGRADVKEIAEALGSAFNIKPVNVYRNKQDLYSRKNQSLFLDRLRKDLIRGLEESDNG